MMCIKGTRLPHQWIIANEAQNHILHYLAQNSSEQLRSSETKPYWTQYCNNTSINPNGTVDLILIS